MALSMVREPPTVRGTLWVAGLFCLITLYLYHETAWSMVAIWSRSETFAHGFLILPISLWLIWTRRDELVAVNPIPSPGIALFILPLGLVWLLASLVDVNVIQQLALVATIIMGTWTILGYAFGKMLVFPLFFLFFAVPMGEGLIAPMMEYTASSTVWMIEMTGVPVYREGLNFALPSGSWSIVEECSGVRYIIASVTVGSLYAYLTYRSWTRRVIFVVISAIVPVIANSLRAFIIVMLGHVSDMTIATGADHLVYGWLFFGLVIFVLFWFGAFFREDQVGHGGDTPNYAMTGGSAAVASSNGTLWLTACIAVLVASAAPVIKHTVFDTTVPTVRDSALIPSGQGGWRVSRLPRWYWRPPSRVGGQQSAYYEAEGEVVGLYLQYADGTIPGADVIGMSTLFVVRDGADSVVHQDKVDIYLPDDNVVVDEARIRGPDAELLVWSWYLVGDLSTSNDYRAKFQQIGAQLGFREAGPGYRIILATPVQSSLADARSRLQRFLNEYSPQLYRGMQSVTAVDF